MRKDIEIGTGGTFYKRARVNLKYLNRKYRPKCDEPRPKRLMARIILNTVQHDGGSVLIWNSKIPLRFRNVGAYGIHDEKTWLFKRIRR